MPYLPLNIDVSGMTILVVGGGTVACRKIMALLRVGGAVINVVSPEILPEIQSLADAGKIDVRTGHYEPNDLENVFLVVAATNLPDVNQKIATDALQRNILVTVVDGSSSGNCSFPAVLNRGNLEISVSTNGTCPGFASEVRDLLAKVIDDRYGTILDTLATEREKLLTDSGSSTYNNQILRSRARELINELIAL